MAPINSCHCNDITSKIVIYQYYGSYLSKPVLQIQFDEILSDYNSGSTGILTAVT